MLRLRSGEFLHFLLSRAVLSVLHPNNINVLILQINIRARRHDHLSAFHALAKIGTPLDIELGEDVIT